VWKEAGDGRRHRAQLRETDYRSRAVPRRKLEGAVSAKSGNPIYERPVILDLSQRSRFLLDQIVPKPGGTVADYDLVIASQPYRARASLEFKQSAYWRRLHGRSVRVAG